MFRFDSPLFWYRLVFLAELMIAEGLFTFKLPRRRYFPLRLAGSVLACYVVTFLLPIAAYNAVYVSFMFVCMFCATVAGLYFCFRAPLLNIAFCAVAAYAVQHIAYEVYTFFVTALGLQAPSGPYEETGEMIFGTWTTFLYIEAYAASYGLMYLFFGSRIKSRTDLHIGNVSLLVISGVILLAAIFLNLLVTYRATEETDTVLLGVVHAYNILCCLLAVFVQFFMLGRKKMQTDLDTLRLLHEQERRHYMIFKENVDYINVKCHDLKHQIRRIARGGNVGSDVIGEIENAVMIYDADVKTGNDALDIVLTEKRLTCVKHGITFSQIADGKQLDIMTDADICSLFGNALDNAIEAVCGIEDKSARVIELTIKASRGFLSVCVRNSCAGDVIFDGDLPRSTKGDDRSHGFGMKSMKAITEKYGGELSVTAESGVFTLNMLFPLSGAREE
ncbi:MAG TPA: ATP-binding protein [Candidatus Protoclostridium stercorigallinarum]|uniref:ATP-binding protein n=1 Tax=Candidatus Protoclostridium stercorigallinarum TaxID=2838741 RepID=A0A9D1Q0Y5_9FIRM|nr:ATP-binding protein [Candidatus Protoclostridium stercorigallinarum]